MKKLLILFSLIFITAACTEPVKPEPTGPAQKVESTEGTKIDYKSLLTVDQNVDASIAQDIVVKARTNHVGLLNLARKRYTEKPIDDYTCTFVKQETIRGKLQKEQHMKVKFRHNPFSVAMLFTKNPGIGDCLVYVDGKYPDKDGRSQMVARPTNSFFRKIIGSVKKLPDADDIMKHTLKPCTQFGFDNGLLNLLEIYELAAKRKELTQSLLGMTTINGRRCFVLLRVLPERKEYPAAITETCVDIETLMPMRIIGYDWKGNFAVNYEYRDVKFNVGLKDKDFTPKANGIATPKK